MDEAILKTLLKKATGYYNDEIQEEYAVKDDGGLSLTKRKITTKYYPPDSAALKAYLELSTNEDISALTDEQLEAERQRLLKQLKDEERAKRKSRKNSGAEPKTK
jgi:hypothetical protein